MRAASAFSAAVLLAGWCGPALAQVAASEYGDFADVNGGRIYYEDRGQGRVLLLLHGFSGTASSWDSYTEDFAGRYRVISWDMRGHGRSEDPDASDTFSFADAARDLLGLMDHLGVDRASAIGASGGGVALLHAATVDPARFEALVFVGTPTYRSGTARRLLETAAFSPERLARLGKTHGPARAQLLVRQLGKLATLYGDGITPDLLATISARTLIVGGDNDPYLPVSQSVEMFDAIPGAHLWIVPNGGHRPQFAPENRDDFLRRVNEFLEGQWGEVSR